MTEHVIVYGAGGFVARHLLSGPKPLAVQLTLVDPVPPERSIQETALGLGQKVDVVVSSRLSGEDDPGPADVLLVVAGQTDVDQAISDPALAFTANHQIAVEACEWWRRNPLARLVYMSSDEVLGVPASQPFAEDAPYAPTQPYAASKAAAEMTVRCYANTYKLDLVVVRSCNLVGSRQRARKLIPTAVDRMARSLPVPVFGTGREMREYLAVEDLCEVLSWAVDHKLDSGIYNASSGVSLSIEKVLCIVASALEPVLKVPMRTEFVDGRSVHDPSYAMDSTLLNKLGWKAQTTPQEAIWRAAQELFVAWERGESLTSPLGDLTEPRHRPSLQQ